MSNTELTADLELNLQFSNIFELDNIQRMQDLFSDATGVASIITHPDGKPITQPSNFTRLCNSIIRKTEKGCANCFKSDALIGRQNTTGPIIQPCLSGGLWDAGASITIGGKHIANWLIGQVRNEAIDNVQMAQYADEIGADKAEFIKALAEVPVMSADRFKKISDMLFAYVNEFSEKAYVNLQLRRQMDEREKATELLQKSEEFLAITLHSIGDGVITTDNNGFIVNMNPIAEQLCGWKWDDAKGKPLTQVFNIIKEESRKPAANPVEKVLKTRKIEGLENHTILISKNGLEYQIADSAAPIINNFGIITGVVLVFSDVTKKHEAEQKTKESEQKYSILFNDSPDAYLIIENGVFIDCNRATETIMGGDRSEIIGQSPDALSPEFQPDGRKSSEAVSEIIKQTLISGNSTFEWTHCKCDGSIFFVEVSLSSMILGGKTKLFSTWRDITERKRIEETLQNERLMLRTLIDNIPDLIYTKDLASRKTLANLAEVRIMGANSEAEVLGKNDFDIYPKELAEKYFADDQQVLQTGKPILYNEELVIDKDGKKKWMLFSKLLLRDKNNQITGLLGVSHDITIRRQAELALQKSETFLKQTQLITKLGTYTLDIIADCWESSEILNVIFGIDNNAKKNMGSWLSLVHPDNQQMISDYYFNQVLGNKTRFDKEYKIIRQNDLVERWIHGLGELELDDKNQPIRMIGTIRDITEQKEVEEALLVSEGKYRNIFDNVKDVFYQVDLAGNITEISPSIKYFTEFDRNEMIGTPIENLYANPEERIILLNTLSKNNEVSDYELNLKTKTGIIKHVSVNARLVVDANGKPTHIDGSLRDITKRIHAEEAMRESEEKYRELVNNSPDAIVIYSEEKIVFVNKESLRLMAASSPEELLNKSILQFVHPDYIEIASERIKSSKIPGTVLPPTELVYIRLDGSNVEVEVKTMVIRLEKKTAVQLIIRDITERKSAEKLLFRSAEEFKDLFDNAPIGYHELDIHGQIVRINETEINMLGYSIDELLGKHWWLLSSDKSASKQTVLSKLSGTQLISGTYERDFIRKDGSSISVLVKDKILKTKDGTITGIRSAVQDITARKQAETTIQNERLLLRAVIDNIPDTIYAKDLAGRKTLANKAEINLLGAISENEVLGKDDFEFYPKNFAKKFKADDELMLKTGKPILNREGFIIDGKGRKHWLLSSKLPLHDKNNKIIGLLGIGRDITIRKQVEEALLESERFLKETQKIAQLGTFSMEIDSYNWECSQVLNSIFGLDDKEIKTIEILSGIIHPDWKKTITDYFLTDVINKKTKFDKKFKIIRYNDQKERWVHGIGELKFDEFNKPIKIIATIQDITDRKLTADALRTSDALYRSILNTSPDVIMLTDMNGIISMVSPCALPMYGCESEKQLLGKNMFDFLVIEDLERARLNKLHRYNKYLGTIEYRIRRADKREFFADVNGDIIRNSEGEPSGMVFIIRDISERKLNEKELSNSQEQLKKFAAHLQNVREEERIALAREIHDELGQILIAIKIDVGILKQNTLKYIDDIAIKDILTKFDHLFGLVDNTINTTRKIMTDLRPEVLYLLGFIEAAKLQTSNFQERHQISCQFENTISNLKINIQQSVALFRILQEALVNVAKHSKATSVTVKLSTNASANKLTMRIIDNGIGFNDKKAIKHDSYGIIGMKERVFLLDGLLSITGKNNKGTTIKVEMPYYN